MSFSITSTSKFINTIDDEQDMTNFRILSDYLTSLAQTWINNYQFFGLDTKQPFLGTQLVLLSRQLSVISDTVNEVRFTLDSVFISQAERQTLQLEFTSGDPALFGKICCKSRKTFRRWKDRSSSRMPASWASATASKRGAESPRRLVQTKPAIPRTGPQTAGRFPHHSREKRV